VVNVITARSAGSSLAGLEAAAHALRIAGAPPRGHHDFFKIGACAFACLGMDGRQQQALGKR
ncbi:MAG: hypothetical protein OXI07_05035, partial [Gammaproteobacteria bacterium]|nr:hypothetical protein [Gammaproteobacteria bacterium]